MTEPINFPTGTVATIAAPKPPLLGIETPDRSALIVPVLKGPKGNTGDKGEPGNSFGVTAWWSGHGSPNDNENSIVGAKVGDYYTDLDTGLVYTLGD